MIRRSLIAYGGEIAIRIARAAGELGIATVAVFATDDAASPHPAATEAAEATRLARRALGQFQGALADGRAATSGLCAKRLQRTGCGSMTYAPLSA